MKILKAGQIKEVDEASVKLQHIQSIDLMERAAHCCEKKLIKEFTISEKIYVVCGKGNNGGDGLAIARLLAGKGFNVKVFVIHYSEKFSEDAQVNYDLFKAKHADVCVDVYSINNFLENSKDEKPVVIDALFGTGLNRPLAGLTAEVIDHVNVIAGKIISIDIPSGLFADETSVNNKSIIKASLVLTFQLPKLAFFMPENERYVNDFLILDIELSAESITEQKTTYYFLKRKDVSGLLKKRNNFDHKGTFGHALLVAGSKGKGGAAIIAANACLRSGAGMLTVHSVNNVITALTPALPEAMSSADENNDHVSLLPTDIEKYEALAFGPGIGMHEDSQAVLKNLVQNYTGKLIIDADGLNILSENKTWLSFLVPSAILSPHVKEFERLAGKSSNDFERLETLKAFSIKHGCIIILKGAYTTIAMPDGNVFFNSSGNAGLAKAGSGDGLTGIILGLLARGYNAPKAALIGAFIHGYAADLCAKKMSLESILITDVIEQLPRAFSKVEDSQ
ncbi:MAG: NAD(P)H-hydrate dehydratase [Bacteroidetes bacterium]|nr:NAD(P)H-hydrate dehydratase [Bacteroidota bacterium]